MSDDEAEQKKFETCVEELRIWFKNRCTPSMAVSVMGALTSEFIFNYSKSERAAENEVADFCSRVVTHVRVLNASADDMVGFDASEEVTLQ